MCGADIVKFQLYNVDYISNPSEPDYNELKFSQLTRKRLQELFKESQKANIEFMASVFDAERVKWTEELGMKRYKIASSSINDKALIKAIEKTGKPIIASLGYWHKSRFPKIKGQVDYLYCVSKYPTLESDLEGFPAKFNRYSGFSDHTIGIKWAKIAIDRGARIIEKHFTLNKRMGGTDQKGSADPDELKEIVNYLHA